MNERIENYLGQGLSASEKAQFEADLKSDPELAAALARYMTAKKTSIALKSKEQAGHPAARQFSQLRLWYGVAAALAFAAFGLAWYFLAPAKPDLQQTATEYSEARFVRLTAEMDDSDDSTKLAAEKFNDGQYATGTKICDAILVRHPQNAEAKRIAGIVALRLLNYDKAIMYFNRLGTQTGYPRNPGKFYEAIALLQSGSLSNKLKAETLLREVIDSELEGKKEAIKWLE